MNETAASAFFCFYTKINICMCDFLNLRNKIVSSQINLSSRFIHSKTAATGPVPIEIAFKNELVSILVANQH